jgi:hypothetical protein
LESEHLTASATLEYLKQAAERLPIDDQLRLVEHLVKRMRLDRESRGTARTATSPGPTSLRGIWRDKFPVDADIDAILYEIRHEWEKEFEEGCEPWRARP